MTKKTSYISVRVSPETREALEEIVRNRRMEDEREVSLADLVREALDNYLNQYK